MTNQRKSRIKRARVHGFRVRQSTKKGRQIHSRKRRVGRSCNIKKRIA